jgi:hypothetical protein
MGNNLKDTGIGISEIWSRYVKVSLEIFGGIVSSCPPNLLTFYAVSVVNSLQEVYKQEKKLSMTITPITNPTVFQQLFDLKILATEVVRNISFKYYSQQTKSVYLTVQVCQVC